MTVWPEGSRSATAERIATVLPVPTSPVITAMVFSDTAQAMRQACRGERQLADELVGVGGLGEALAAEGGVVQGADRPGRGAGQGQGPGSVSHGRFLPSLPGLPASPAPAGRR